MKHIKMISYYQARKRGFINGGDFTKCYFCGSDNLSYDKNQPIYREEIAGCLTPAEYGIVCNKCHTYQGMCSFGAIYPIYVKEAQ